MKNIKILWLADIFTHRIKRFGDHFFEDKQIRESINKKLGFKGKKVYKSNELKKKFVEIWKYQVTHKTLLDALS